MNSLNALRGHRPLYWLTLITAIASLVILVPYLVDDRQLLGVSVWEKPLKFLLSSTVFTGTFAWLFGKLQRQTRVIWWTGTVITISLAIELAIILTLGGLGVQSHFNVSDAFHITIWSIMATMISLVWVATAVLALATLRNSTLAPAQRAAVQAGLLIAVVGMGLAFLMTSPNAAQLENFQGIAGSHNVGVADGGPGLPLLGWSTVAGDYRVAHFLGLHGLQALLIASFAITRLPLLRKNPFGQVWVLGLAYLAVTLLAAVQAIQAESVVNPSTQTLWTLAAIAAFTVTGSLLVATVRLTPREAKRPTA